MGRPAADAKDKGLAAAFAPLGRPVFAMLWAATLVGNVGTFMRDVASAWLAAGLTTNPAAVAAVQAAATLPMFLFALPAGVLADILDRRRLLVAVQIGLAVVSVALCALAAASRLTIELLVGFAFLGGLGAALAAPSWQSIVPELVSRPQLRGAVALQSLGFNISRAIGPAAGGIVLATFGAAATYGIDAASYILVIAALLLWRRPPATPHPLSETFLGGFQAGLRYVRSSEELRVVLGRTLGFIAFTSAIWALLPLLARRTLAGGAAFYGLLLGAVGVGAILGALALPAARRRWNSDRLLLLSALVAAGVTGALAAFPSARAAPWLMGALGVGWIVALTTLNSAAQAVLPPWVRGRGLAVYLMVFNGGMAFGSLAWGAVAAWLGIAAALGLASCGLAVAAVALHRLRLPSGDLDLQPALHWRDPSDGNRADRGPVLVQIEYEIHDDDKAEFLRVIRRLADERRRDGAYAWGVAEHAGLPGRVIEWFLVASWAEHLRQHRRVTRADADLQAEVQRFHRGDSPPRVDHFVAIDSPDLP